MKTRFLSLLMLLPLVALCQVSPSNDLLFDPDAVLRKGDPAAQVLLVGSFHFAYYGLDAHVTKEKDQVNVLLPQRQKEMDELVAYIAQFKPTKIVVEGGRNSGYLMQRYRQYQETGKARANEVDQIAFRLMKQFSLDTLYGVNSWTLVQDLNKHKDSLTLRPILDSIYNGWDFRSKDLYSTRYDRLYDLEDKYTIKHSLLETFKHMNDDHRVDLEFGAYLVGDFKNGTYEGSDALAMHWYARNLRIFRNIQNVTEAEDRILVLFGAGHMSILKNLFVCSPEYDYVPFGGALMQGSEKQ